jgi:lipopolysaccharide export system ATP-binding protein
MVVIFMILLYINNLKAIVKLQLNDKNLIENKINYLISKFELENLKNVKAKFLSGGQKKN